ncbi:hypothetical protein HPB47_011820 [Ixodes persulcatus]|uniref:Uncharacterized protein n=1 Tax=Ixodes persulcatus TaxID=34615 RepID=A0AC60NVG5_IXOPE|nr:hypothetical protein HPB47_011820 [Ixodes persulcatus]
MQTRSARKRRAKFIPYGDGGYWGGSGSGPHLIDLPDGFLQGLETYLRECSDDCNTGVTVDTVHKASVAVQVLTILSRNFSNIPFVSTSEAVPLTIVISSAVANQYTKHSKDATDQNTAGFLLSVLTFLEVLYDPHLIWQMTCSRVSPSHLHLEVIPFFYDCLSSKPCFLPAAVQMKLIHVFGAIICGAQHNAQVAINHNTVDILFQRLREQECSLEVKMTAVRCIMQGIVTLCACVPEALKSNSAQKIAASSVRLIHVFLSRFPFAKKHFASMQGYRTLFSTLKTLGEPHQATLEALLEWLVEETPRRERSCTPVLRNLDVMIHLLHWLPQLESRGTQLWLVEQLEGTVQGSLRSRLDCTRAGVISALIQVLGRSTSLGGKAVGRLLHFLVTLGSCSMSTAELKALFHLLRPDASGEQHQYTLPLMYALSNMVKSDGWLGASHFFDFSDPDEGIVIPAIRKWPGSGFGFHAWLRLDKPDSRRDSPSRRHLYSTGNDAAVSRRTSGGSGDSATSPGAPTTEGGRFGASPTDPGNAAGVSFLRNTTLGSFLSGWDAEKIFSMAPSVPANLRSAFNADPDPSIVVTPVDSHEQVWGTSEGLRGQIGSLCVFSEPLQASQVKIMYTGGPKNYTLFKNEDSVDVADLLAKLVVYYDAKASVDGVCTNLAPTLSQYDGRVTGRYCHTQNVKDIINLIGGYPTLYLLLENSGKPVPKGSPSFETTSPPSSNRPSEEVVDDWIVVPSASSSFSGKSTLVPHLRLAQNQVSSFLVIVQHLMNGSSENQMQLLARTGIPTIGALMQRVPGHCIDVNVLMAVQLLVENASSAENAQEMLKLVYQHILFDFRIWSKGSFPVRLGHIQYLTTIIKEDRKYFRKKYGPKFLLDMVQMFYSDCSLLSSDDVKTIRMAVLALVRFYMLRDVNIQDVNAVVSYVLSQKKEELVKEVVEILLQLLEGSATRDQLVLLLYEPNCAELFYCLLLNREFSSCTKVKVLKLIEVLLKSDKVYEKSKSRLRLSEVGFASLTGLVSANEVTAEVAKELVNLVLMTDISQGFQGFLALLNLMKTMDVEVKYYAAQKLLSALNENAASLPALAQQTGWQECVLSLLIKEPISEASCANRATLPSLDLIDLSSLETEAANADSEKPGSPVLKRGTLHRLSQRALVAQQSIEEILPGSPKAASQLLSHLKEHIFDFEITQLLGSGRSRSNSQCSSQEDLSLAGPDAAHRSSPIVVTPAPSRKAPELSPRVSPAQHLFGGSPARSPVENGTAGGGGIEARLIETVVEAAFLLAWRGIEGCSKHSWMERGQVLVCINKLALTNELFSSHLDIKRQLFERLLQACCSNLQESGITFLSSMKLSHFGIKNPARDKQ